MNIHDERQFDAGMRDRDLAAARALPPSLRAQLRQAPAPLPWWRHWQLPAGMATAVLFVALAVALPRLQQPVPAGQGPQLAGETRTAADPLADPEFYAWLATADAQHLALE